MQLFLQVLLSITFSSECESKERWDFKIQFHPKCSFHIFVIHPLVGKMFLQLWPCMQSSMFCSHSSCYFIPLPGAQHWWAPLEALPPWEASPRRMKCTSLWYLTLSWHLSFRFLECFTDFNLLPQHWDSIYDHGHFMVWLTENLKDSAERTEHHQVDHQQGHMTVSAIGCWLFKEPTQWMTSR